MLRGDLPALPLRQHLFDIYGSMSFVRALTLEDKRGEMLNIEYRISNVEPQKSGLDFEMRHSIFDILRFKGH